MLASKNISSISCKMLKKTEAWHQKYAAFRVVVDVADKDNVFDDVFGQWVLMYETGGLIKPVIIAGFINFASYNLHGFQHSKSQLLELCNSHEVSAVQEHWLSDYNLIKILNLHNESCKTVTTHI